MYFTVCLPCGHISIPSHARVFRGIFLWLITLCQLALSQRGRSHSANSPGVSVADHTLPTRPEPVWRITLCQLALSVVDHTLPTRPEPAWLKPCAGENSFEMTMITGFGFL